MPLRFSNGFHQAGSRKKLEAGAFFLWAVKPSALVIDCLPNLPKGVKSIFSEKRFTPSNHKQVNNVKMFDWLTEAYPYER